MSLKIEINGCLYFVKLKSVMRASVYIYFKSLAHKIITIQNTCYYFFRKGQFVQIYKFYEIIVVQDR